MEAVLVPVLVPSTLVVSTIHVVWEDGTDIDLLSLPLIGPSIRADANNVLLLVMSETDNAATESGETQSGWPWEGSLLLEV